MTAYWDQAVAFKLPDEIARPVTTARLKQPRCDDVPLMIETHVGATATRPQRALVLLLDQALCVLVDQLERQRSNLVRGGYAPDCAMVRRDDWLQIMVRDLGHDSAVAEALVDTLVEAGRVRLESGRTYAMPL